MGTFEVGLNAFCIVMLPWHFGGQGVKCGDLCENACPQFWTLNTWSPVGNGPCHQTENLVRLSRFRNHGNSPENGRLLNLLLTMLLPWNLWPWYTIERTVRISHVGATVNDAQHADMGSLTFQSKPTEINCFCTPTHPKMYIRPYTQGINYMSYFTKDCLRVTF